MRSSPAKHLLSLVGALCAAAGLLAWIGLAWMASEDLDAVTPQGEEGGRLMVWALSGTLLMILGAVLLHLAQGGAEAETPDERSRER